jgi:hypothetical protein
MSKIAIELKDFKHVKSNETSTTLRHKEGHLLKIAHSALSPEFQSQLKALASATNQDDTPLQSTAMANNTPMADGGDVKKVTNDTNYKGIESPDRHPGGGTLNYKDFKKETSKKNKEIKIEERSKQSYKDQFPHYKVPRQKFAQGTPNEPVETEQSQDPAPQTQTDQSQANPSQARVEAMMNKYAQTPQTLKQQQIEDSGKAPAGPDEAEQYAESQEPSFDEPESKDQTQNADDKANPEDQSQPEVKSSSDDSEDSSSSDGQPSLQDVQAQTAQGAQIEAAPSPQQTAQNVTSNLLNQSEDYKQDLANGHITPADYGSVFAHKSTLGKIATVFGLMVGGGGAAIAGQPNMLLDMMQQEIKSDMDAQEKTQANAQNLYHLNLQHQLQQSQIGLLTQQGKLTAAQAYGALTNAKLAARSLSIMNANDTVLKHLVDQTNQYPPGSPQYQKAVQTLSLVRDAIVNQNYRIAGQAGAESAYMQKLGVFSGPDGTSSQSSGVINGFQPMSDSDVTQHAQSMQAYGSFGKQQADFITSHHFNGLPPEYYGQRSNTPIAQGDRDHVQDVNLFNSQARQLLSFIDKNRLTPENIAHLNLDQRQQANVIAGDLQNYLAHAADPGAMTEGRAQWANKILGAKNPLDVLYTVMGHKAGLEQVIKSNDLRRQQILNKYGIQARPVKVDVNGNHYVRGDNSKAVLVRK